MRDHTGISNLLRHGGICSTRLKSMLWCQVIYDVDAINLRQSWRSTFFITYSTSYSHFFLSHADMHNSKLSLWFLWSFNNTTQNSLKLNWQPRILSILAIEDTCYCFRKILWAVCCFCLSVFLKIFSHNLDWNKRSSRSKQQQWSGISSFEAKRSSLILASSSSGLFVARRNLGQDDGCQHRAQRYCP